MNFSPCENRFDSNSSDSSKVMKPLATLYLVPTSPLTLLNVNGLLLEL